MGDVLRWEPVVSRRANLGKHWRMLQKLSSLPLTTQTHLLEQIEEFIEIAHVNPKAAERLLRNGDVLLRHCRR